MGTWRPYVVFVIIAIIIQSCIVYSQRATKSSLTFVIDDSGSMSDEIEQVKDSVDSIFDTVMNSNQSHIKNFVLVTFNDPDYILYAVTEDRATFKAAAAKVHIRDGIGECPERAMLGIKIGIENSLPMSTLYVFTDASAKDYGMYDEIKAMAQRKQIQVTFLLSDDCGSRDDEDYQVYVQLAQITNGEVFNLMKKDIKDILKYVKENTKSRGNFIASKSFPPGYGFKFNFTVDSRTKEFTMSIAGLNPKLEITDPNGHLANTEPIVEKDEILIVKVTDTIPGLYKARVGSRTGTSAKVTGQSDIHFEFGFSKLEPTSLSVTATRPEADGKSYLSIQLYGDGVTFKTAKIFDLNDILLKELPLRLLDNKTNFYVTEQFEPPKTTFRIFVSGYDDVNKMGLNQSAGSLTGPRDPDESVQDVAPEVTIIEGNKVILDYNSALLVTCKVHAHPPPEITWRDIDTGEIIPTSVTEVAPPYDFISTLNIEKYVNRHGTYSCTAKNSLGQKDSQLIVETNIYFNVLETPKNTTSIEFDKEGSVSCVVNASPPVTTIWYKDGRPLSNDTNVVIASGNTTLTIKHMDLELAGTYICEVRNELQRQVFNSEVETFGLEKPVIDVTENKITVIKGDNIELVCRITQGVPKPTIRWYYQPQAGDSKQTLAETSDTLQLKTVTIDSNGKYTCNATNLVGSDTFTIELNVEYAPTIKTDDSSTIQPEQGDAVTIPCKVDGVPPPIVKWFRNGTPLDSTMDIDTTSSLKFHTIAVSDSGLYKCQAENRHGSANKTVSVDVTAKPIIDKSHKKIQVTKGDDAQLACRITQGTPKPTIQWYYEPQAEDSVQTLNEMKDTLQLKTVTVDSNGKYTCNATNLVGSDTFTIELNVEYTPTIETDGPTNIQPEQGNAITIPCDVDGIPPPTVKWLKNGTPLDSTLDIEITDNHSLKFHAIMISDSGLYKCQAENRHGSANKTVSVDVTAKPMIDKTNNKITVIKGDDYQLACRTTQGTPTPTIRWYYQSQAGDSVQTLAETGDTLQLKTVTVGSNGKYTCNATNLVGSDTFTIELNVEYTPTIETDGPNNIQPEQGNAITITCDVDGVPPPTVKWLKNGTPLDSTLDIEITDNHSLKFHAIMISDSGLYKCQAENRHGSANKTVSVDVTAKPIIDKTNNKITVIKGDDYQLACRTTQGTPMPIIRWYYQPQAGDSKQTLAETSDTLQLKTVTVYSNGKYTCNATNLVGSDTFTIELNVEYTPTIETDGPNNIQPEQGNAITITCDVDGVPPPTVKWLKNGTPLDSTLDIEITDNDSLKFHAIMISDSGLYKCQAKNRHGSANKTVSVDVTAKPIIDKTNNKITVIKGDDYQLACRTTQGTPMPTIRWYYQPQAGDSVQTLAETSDTLQLKTVTVDSNGKYTCNATNLVGSDTFTIELNVEYTPTIETDGPNNIQPEQGNAITIPCDVDGVPPPTVKWLKNGTPLDSTLDIEITDTNSLKFHAIMISDSGLYKCQAKNRHGSANKTVSVDVTAKPIINKTNKKITVIKGDDYQLACRTTQGTPMPTIRWYYQPQSGDSVQTLAETSDTLQLKTVTVDSNGKYTCNATNLVGSDTFTIEVNVEYPPTIKEDPMNAILIKQGDTVNIPCEVDGVPVPTVKWLKNGIRLDSAMNIEITANHSLTFGSIMVTDIGYYTCVAENHIASRNKTVFVDVAVGPQIETVTETNITRALNQRLELKCLVNGHPQPDIEWIHTDFDGETMPIKILNRDHGQYLFTENVLLKDEGYYTCVASNIGGSANIKYKVNVNAKPIIRKTDYEKRVRKGENVQLSCRVSQGNPKPTIQWYFQSKDSKYFLNLNEMGENLQLRSVTTDNSGTYQCNASNVEGFDLQITEFIVEYPPSIKDDGYKTITANQDDIIIIPCDVDGIPTPSVTWFKNGALLRKTKKTVIMRNNSLRIIAMSVSGIDNYSCMAENRLGSRNKTISVNVYAAPIIEVPEETTIEKNVGEYLILWCRADGYPIPNIAWTYYNDSGIKKNKLLKYDKTSMALNNLQVKDSGYYLCEAKNDAGPSRLTYRVIVIAPPVIVDVYPEKTIKTVKGDSVLRVPCDVTGNPKPTVTWIKDGSNVDLGTPKYDTDNGTLLIMIIDKESAGNYMCVAENKIGNANVSYDVIVTDYPELDSPVSTKFIEKGQNVNIACDIPHNRFDLVRWYKDYNLINNGELTLNNPQPSDNGVYSCRVSNSTKSSSAHVNLTVGYKPYFTSEEKLYHEFVEDDSLGLRCSAKGSPIPKVSWWLNGENLDETNMSYELIMRLDNRGNYTCEISNELGSIQRSFTVAAKGCILDAKKDFLDKKQPLMLSSSRMWPMFDVTKGYMFLNKDDIFNLHCPRGFDNFHTQFIEARCESETNVKVNGKVYKYAEIKCKAEIEPTAQIFRGGCLAGHNTTYIQVGYDADGRFFKVYDVCLDNEDEVPLYTQHIIDRAQYGVTKNLNQWFGHIALPLDFDTIYDCVTQVEDISTKLGKPFHQYDKCCYNKRQLVDSKDLRPGIPPAVVYSYLNVVPHWSTCNSKNWAVVEQKVRDLAQLRDNELIITTGTANPSRISSSVHSSDIILHDKRGRTQPVAQYLWKVVQDPVSKGSLAIIQINVPDISKARARKYVHCRDICGRVGWMDSSNWHNVADGYTFCCSILEFESMFHYNGQFNNNMITILSDFRDADYR